MIRSRHVSVEVDLAVIRNNVRRIAAAVRVPLLAVVKADAYGLGAKIISQTIAELVNGFYVFNLAEAIAYDLVSTGRRTLALRADCEDPEDFLAHRVQPAVWDYPSAMRLRAAHPVLSVDTGQQRFGVPANDTTAIESILAAGRIEEAFTHATTPGQAELLRETLGGRAIVLHAAGSALLHEPRAWMDTVRPGLAMYQGAVRVHAPLIEVRETTGPAGYTGFTARRHGVILAGYSNGFRTGPCVVKGRRSRILEVGMQSAFVELGEDDRVSDEVSLLGDGLTEQEVAAAWSVSPQEALFRLAGMGDRLYRREVAPS